MRLKSLFFPLFITALTSTAYAQVKIGSNPGTITPGALLDIEGSTTTTRTVSLPNGNFGIGVTAPVAKLDVAGNVRIVDGTQGAGKVLTSDANGLASWVTPALALIGNTLSINGGNSVTLPNQSLALSGNTLSISGGNSVTLPNQSLGLNGNTLSISGGNSVTLPTAPDKVIASARQSQGQGFPPGSTQVDLISTEFESYGGTVDLQNDVIRIPRSGYYQIGGTIGLGDVSSDPNVVNTYKLSACIYYQVNGADFGENCIRNENGSRQSGSFVLIKYLNQGDAISVRIVNVEKATFPGKGGFSDLQIMEIR